MLQIFLQLWRFNSSGSIFNILPLQAEGARGGVPRGEIWGGCGGSCWGHGAGTAGYGVTRSQRLLGGTHGGAHGSSSSQFLVLVSLQTPAPRATGSRWALQARSVPLVPGYIKKKTTQTFQKLSVDVPTPCAPRASGSALLSPSPPSTRGDGWSWREPRSDLHEGKWSLDVAVARGGHRARAEPWVPGSTPTAPQ